MQKKDRKKYFNTIFAFKSTPFPWTKAMAAAICSGVPVVVGLLFGRLDLGLIGAMGSFSYLYVFNEPYLQRAKKMFFVIFGIAFSVALGAIASPYPALVVLIVGLIGFIVTFIFGVLKMTGPAAIFFVLTFLMSSNMPTNSSSALVRFVIVLLSGSFSWIMIMMGWIFNPHGPEKNSIKEVFLALSVYSEEIGREDVKQVRHRTVIALNELEEILFEGYIPWKNAAMFNRLYLLNEQSNKIYLELLELSSKNIKLPIEISKAIKKIALGIKLNNLDDVHVGVFKENESFNKLVKIIYDTEKLISNPMVSGNYEIEKLKPSIKFKISQAFDKNSIVFINATRYAIIISIASIVSYLFPFRNRYWIPATCAAVMIGSTIMSTFNRSIQRLIGTIIGLVVSFIIFKYFPQGYMIAVTTIILTLLTELFVVKNYAVANIFITPNTLLLAEASMQTNNASYFLEARIITTAVGALIGLIGTYYIGRRTASSRLLSLMVPVIKSQANLLDMFASDENKYSDLDYKLANEKMQIELMNLSTAYTTALGETLNNKEVVEKLWPAFFSIEHLSYLLDQCCLRKFYINMNPENLNVLVKTLDTLFLSIERKKHIKKNYVTSYDKMQNICIEINRLIDSLSIIEIK